jgi:hypothetical protein
VLVHRSIAAVLLVGALAVGAGACGDTDDTGRDAPESTAPSMSSTSTSAPYGYDGTFGGRDEAGTAGGDANPDAANNDDSG